MFSVFWKLNKHAKNVLYLGGTGNPGSSEQKCIKIHVIKLIRDIKHTMQGRNYIAAYNRTVTFLLWYLSYSTFLSQIAIYRTVYHCSKRSKLCRMKVDQLQSILVMHWLLWGGNAVMHSRNIKKTLPAQNMLTTQVLFAFRTLLLCPSISLFLIYCSACTACAAHLIIFSFPIFYFTF